MYNQPQQHQQQHQHHFNQHQAPPLQPNQPPLQPNQPPLQPNQPPLQPNQPPLQPNQPPYHPSQAPAPAPWPSSHQSAHQPNPPYTTAVPPHPQFQNGASSNPSVINYSSQQSFTPGIHPNGAHPPLPQPIPGHVAPNQQHFANDAGLAHDFGRMDIGAPPPPLGHLDTPNTIAKTKRPARAFHQEQTPASGFSSPMPPRPDLNTGEVFRHRPDRPAHLQNYEHRPMPVVPPGPPLPSGPESAIPPLPSSGGQRLAGPRNRIDPNQIPSPVIVHEQDSEMYEQEPFRTCQSLLQSSSHAQVTGAAPVPQVPLSLTDYVAVDEGNCTPRFIRSTTYCLPATEDLAQSAELPLGLIIQPLAELGEGEGDCVPLVDFSQDPTGPPRCNGCRGYINPWCTFIDGGQRFRCNLCGKPSDVPSAYFCHLDMSGRRVDHYQRAELCRGSVDFIVNKEYWVQNDSNQSRAPRPMKYLFAIDVSWSSVKSGMLREVTKSIKNIIFDEDVEVEDLDENEVGSYHRLRRKFVEGGQVGFVTFDRTVHFYNLKGGLEQAQMLVVSELDDMFVPIGEESLFVDPRESRVIIENLLDSLPNMFEDNQIVESAVGGPVQAALSSLRRLGGQLNVFLTSLPTIGPGALKQREDTKLYNIEKESSLFNPADPWYRQISEECSLAGIGINLFLFPSQYIDVATISVLSGITGGEVFFHPRFTPQRDACKVHAELRRVLTRETACSVTMRIRCSNGVRVSEHFGSFLQRNVTDLEFGNIDADKAIAAILKVEGKLEERNEVQFQCALLYTSSNGQRRVRCHNLALPITHVMGNVFRSADMDATITAVTKQYIAQATHLPLKDVRATLTESCVKVLLAYRKHCASSTSPGQLILPESYKLFPLYALGLIKTKALKGGNVSSDVRTHHMRYLKSMGVGATVLMLYPRMIPIHQLSDQIASVKPNGRLKLAPLMRASYLRMEPDGAYLLENGDVMLLWLGNSVSPQILIDLFGVSNLDEIDPNQYNLLKLDNKLSKQVRSLLKYYEVYQRGGRRLPLLICRQNVDSNELEFANLLVEDQNNDAMSYVDYLCFVHKQIQNDLSGEKRDEGSIDASALWRAAW